LNPKKSLNEKNQTMRLLSNNLDEFHNIIQNNNKKAIKKQKRLYKKK